MLKKASLLFCSLVSVTRAASFDIPYPSSQWTVAAQSEPLSEDLGPLIREEVLEPKKDDFGFFTRGELIYWKTTGSNWPYVTLASDPSPIQGILEKASAREVPFNYDPGFRIGVGYEFDYGWDFSAVWSRFFSDGRANNNPNSAYSFVETIWTFIPAPVLTLKARQFVHYDRVDFLFSKDLYLGKQFHMNTNFGPLYARIHQNLNLATTQNFVGGVIGKTKTALINHFDGGGAELGLKGSYLPFNGISLYAGGSCALLYGKFFLQKNGLTTLSSSSIEIPITETFKEKSVVSAFNINAGLQSRWSFAQDSMQLIAHIGYELEIWPDQLRIYRILPISLDTTVLILGTGNLGFQGLNMGLELRF